jgi:23S rRNA pseudouridine2605 synthase
LKIRLQKLLSEAGIASRRKAEELILEGRVRVNNAVITELGSKADPEKDIIKVNGKIIKIQSRKIYIALHKPVGIISSRKDEKNRKTVIDLIPIKNYIYPVGRLDFDSSGLIILTNDGEVANELLHPGYKIPKTYIVEIDGAIKKEQLANFSAGIELEDGITAPARARVISGGKDSTRLEVIISEGKNRQIRRMFESLGFNVQKLKRTKIGNISLGNLSNGEFRYLTDEEIKWLKQHKEKRSSDKP